MCRTLSEISIALSGRMFFRCIRWIPLIQIRGKILLFDFYKLFFSSVWFLSNIFSVWFWFCFTHCIILTFLLPYCCHIGKSGAWLPCPRHWWQILRSLEGSLGFGPQGPWGYPSALMAKTVKKILRSLEGSLGFGPQGPWGFSSALMAKTVKKML